jgi:hypothetical protein
MLRMEEILRMEKSASHWNGFFKWNDSTVPAQLPSKGSN